jgi:pyruvate/2-oxoglutarate dehydrogenase complex dihydrolipoamide dehydrogenase (E3) component
VSAPEYDLVVVGSGPAGQKGAIAAAKARKRVAVIDRTGMLGGVSVHRIALRASAYHGSAAGCNSKAHPD